MTDSFQLPPGSTVTYWCSLFCQGNEATGELLVEYPDGETVAIPVCEECAERATSGAPEYTLDLA